MFYNIYDLPRTITAYQKPYTHFLTLAKDIIIPNGWGRTAVYFIFIAKTAIEREYTHTHTLTMFAIAHFVKSNGFDARRRQKAKDRVVKSEQLHRCRPYSRRVQIANTFLMTRISLK